MKNRLYAMLPEAAIEWERRKAEALSRMPRAELREETKQEIADYMDENREYIRQYLSMFFNQRKPMEVIGGVAHIHINDFLGGDLTFVDRCMGASDYGDIAKELREANSREDIKAVFLDVNSGGGAAVGCVETGRILSELAASKVVYAMIDRIGCSAAYAISCGATQIFAAPSAMVGSVGTIMTWFDYAAMLEEEGIAPHVVTNEGADLKGAANPYVRPTDAQNADLQDFVNEFGFQFQAHVLESRGNLPADAFRGQAVSGRKAVGMRFIDGVADKSAVIAALEGIAGALS